MVFKLVQIDSEAPIKINLEPGSHIFGRGKFLNINDKRISRQHGQFEVTDDSLIITALHQNPCFYQTKGTTEAQVLKQNSSVSLNNGDKLGLLPTCLWFEVLHCLPMDNDEKNQTDKEFQENTNKLSVDPGEETDNEESDLNSVSNANDVSENGNFESQSTEVLSPSCLNSRSDCNDKDSEERMCDGENVPIIDKPNENPRVSPDFDSEKTHVDEPMSPSLISSNQDNEESTNVNDASPSKQSSAVQKRPHSVSEDSQSEEVKKIKTESEQSEEKPVVKCDPDGQQASSSANDGANPQAAPAPLRERCMYGASCYRRNPAHRAQFSHPSDADWGGDGRAPCPWGAACGKRDPRHWRDHSHPPGKDQPPSPQPGRKRKKRRDRSESPESPTNLIVTGKRKRKAVVHAGWSGSESDSDPYKTDEDSDVWEPSSEYTESQN